MKSSWKEEPENCRLSVRNGWAGVYTCQGSDDFSYHAYIRIADLDIIRS